LFIHQEHDTMPSTDTNRRLRPCTINQDVHSMNGLHTVPNYITSRLEATPEALQIAYEDMLDAQREETEQLARLKAATDRARLAEWQFHDNILAMKECVRGQFGSNSDEAQSIGYKKKSERKRPRRPVA
jgi:hypothetical protein